MATEIKHTKSAPSGAGNATHRPAKVGGSAQRIEHRSSSLQGGVHRRAVDVPPSPGVAEPLITHQQPVAAPNVKIKHDEAVQSTKAEISHVKANLPLADGSVPIDDDAPLADADAQDEPQGDPFVPSWATGSSAAEDARLRESASKKDQAESARLYRTGREDRDRGNLAGALHLFVNAHKLFPEHALKFDIAKSLDGLKRKRDAVDAYRWFLLSDPPARLEQAITQARARLVELDVEAQQPDGASQEDP